MTYQLRNYRHRNPKGGDNKKSSSPFFKNPQKATVRKKKQGGFFQAKLAVGEPGDSHEKEADAMASQVTRPTGEASGVQKKELSGVQRLATSKEDEKLGTNDARMEKDKEEPMKPVQKQDAPEKGKKEEEKPVQKAETKKDDKKEKKKGVQKKAGGEEKKKKKGVQKAAEKKKEKPVQKAKEPKKEKKEAVKKKGDGKKEKKEKPVQKKEMSGQVQKKEESTTSETVAEEIKKQSGKGSPLPPKVLAEMSKSFGVDFSNVRVHHDMAAAKLCQELHAMAFTHGQDIYFNEGKYNPGSAEGKMLLAHELTHVVQQANSIDS